MPRQFAIVIALAAAATLGAQPARTLDIYFIDTEGGASTLVVTPAGEAVLMDAGYGGFDHRDPARIERVLTQEAKLSRIDVLLTSHFHGDHAGGIAELAKRIPIGMFVDHGDSVDRESGDGKTIWETYLSVAGTKRHVARPGERLPLKGVDLTIVAGDGKVVDAPLRGGAANPLCAGFTAQAEDRSENGRSLGYILTAGRFEFVNLGDLSWNFQQKLACPVNALGKIDLFQSPHHAVRDDVLPQLMWSMAPAVTVMTNGPAKGAGVAAVETILKSPGAEDVWSLHRLLANDAAHNAPETMTANLTDTAGCAGAWIRARVTTTGAGGTYTVTNSRNQFSKTYKIRD